MEEQIVEFLGPGPYHTFHHPVYGVQEFKANQPRAAKPEVVKYVLSLNPRGATLDNIVDLGGRLYRLVDATGEPVAPVEGEGGGND